MLFRSRPRSLSIAFPSVEPQHHMRLCKKSQLSIMSQYAGIYKPATCGSAAQDISDAPIHTQFEGLQSPLFPQELSFDKTLLKKDHSRLASRNTSRTMCMFHVEGLSPLYHHELIFPSYYQRHTRTRFRNHGDSSGCCSYCCNFSGT